MNQQPILRFFCFALLLIVDVLLFNLAFLVAYAVIDAWMYPVDYGTYFEVALLAGKIPLPDWFGMTDLTIRLPLGFVLPACIFFVSGMYSSWDEYTFAKGTDVITRSVGMSVAGFVGAVWMIRDRLQALRSFENNAGAEVSEPSDLVWGVPTRSLLIVLILAPVLIWLWRIAANALERRLIGWSARRRPVLIVGEMPISDLERLQRSERPRYSVLGCLRDKPATETELIPVLGTKEKLSEILAAEKVDEVFLLATDLDRAAQYAAIGDCLAHGVRPRLVLGVYETLVAATTTQLQVDTPLYQFQEAGVHGWPLVVKRLIDVSLAAVLTVLTAPIIFAAGVAILLESKGWPVFAQIRVGQQGRRFRVFKLRTMVIDADVKGGKLTEDDDPRITRVGAFLRRTSIDELPQFWNVLRGDMSLVGPRAVIPYVADNFQDWEQLSLAVKPGVTGIAQVSGRDEIGFREKSLLNLYYVRNHSTWLDLRILFDTIGVVLSMEGTAGTRGTGTVPAAAESPKS